MKDKNNGNMKEVQIWISKKKPLVNERIEFSKRLSIRSELEFQSIFYVNQNFLLILSVSSLILSHTKAPYVGEKVRELLRTLPCGREYPSLLFCYPTSSPSLPTCSCVSVIKWDLWDDTLVDSVSKRTTYYPPDDLFNWKKRTWQNFSGRDFTCKTTTHLPMSNFDMKTHFTIKVLCLS